MTAISNNDTKFFISKEVSTAASGVTLTSASGIAMQYIVESGIADHLVGIKKFARNFVFCGLGASAIVGAVMTIYSMVMLCKKSITKENALQTSIKAAALGVIGSALSESLWEYFCEIAPSFYILNLEGSSLAYIVATNFALQACAVIGIGALVVSAYAAYRVGVAVLTQQQMPKLSEK